MPTVTLFCGLPGAGKTTLARRLEVAGAGIRLCTDDWQAALGVPHAENGVHDRLQQQLYWHGLDLLRHGVSVILEDGLWTSVERQQKFTDARACGARITLHVFDVAYETLWHRLEYRGQPTTLGRTRSARTSCAGRGNCSSRRRLKSWRASTPTKCTPAASPARATGSGSA